MHFIFAKKTEMTTISFQSESKSKIALLSKVAKEMGIQQCLENEFSDEEMALPGNAPNAEKLEAWLSKGNGKEYETAEALNYVKSQLALLKSRK